MKKTIPIIDLFAGPGGLGEGFSKYENENLAYKIGLSIEKDPAAHKTLELRSFFRQFNNSPPDDYYDYLHGHISRRELFEKWPLHAETAIKESWLHELNNGDLALVRKKVKSVLNEFESEHWMLIGGPPCQAYSLAGRSRMGKRVGFENDERHFLYRHYLRLVAHLTPTVFIMENVKGILTASNKGEKIFDKVLQDLEYPGHAIKILDRRKRVPSKVEYDIFSLVVESGEEELDPRSYIIRSEDYGVPQKRHRVILMGVRRDLCPNINIRLNQRDRISLNEVISDLPFIRGGITGVKDSEQHWYMAIEELLSAADTMKIDQATLDIMTLSFSKIKRAMSRGSIRVIKSGRRHKSNLAEWYNDENLKVVLNHQSKAHMKTDLWRYFFAACYALAHKKSPKLDNYPAKLLPAHKNIDDKEKKFMDRFKVQISSEPSSTVTSHISKDGHYFIHPDPTQCRALTVREAARLQSFPDNYFFEGSRTEQYHQVGNAVPPLLAYRIAEVVSKQIEKIIS